MSRVVMVWFRATRADDDVCRERLAELGRRMADAFGIEARAGWRDEAGFRTWLETYEPLSPARCDTFVEALRIEAVTLGLDTLALNGRHVEAFDWAA
ncbi:MAG: DUF4936 family protein [Burkholderiaceae bacterium]|nr:DUF4936 family protein [Burkholderiaceae bacterium]MEB2351124.1 DUF4936 family protein [Burkholderiaceae bacterium]